MLTRRAISTNRKLTPWAFALITVVILSLSTEAIAENISVKFPISHVVRELGEQFNQPLILKVPASSQLSELDLLISFPSNILNFTGGIMTPENPNWIWSFSDISQSGDSLIRIVATALGSNYLSSDSIVLAVLKFQVRSDSSANCGSGKFGFVWNDCNDNTFLDLSSNSVVLSDTVHGQPLTQPPPATGKGASDSCVSYLGGIRNVSYYYGYIWINCPRTPSFYLGDINLNDIAYEIADWVRFAEYFVNGLDAFVTGYTSVVTENSDCNADGRTLTTSDLTYLGLVVVGDTLPFPKRIVDTALFTQDMSARTITLDYTESVAAIFLEFAGDVSLTPLFDTTGSFSISSALVDGYTRVFISSRFSDTTHPTIAPGTILTYTGDGTLVGRDLSTWAAYWIPINVQYLNGSCCVGSTGNVNYSLDDVVDIGDLTELIGYLFIPPTDPLACPAEANIDGDLAVTIDVDDLTALIAYLFTPPNLPPSSCP